MIRNSRGKGSLRKSWPVVLVLVGFLLCTRPALARVLVLDAGHDPVSATGDASKSGAVGTCGQLEFVYNDEAANSVASSLQAQQDWKLVRTRESGQSINWQLFPETVLLQNLSLAAQANWSGAKTLYARAAIANAAHCDALISLHHDATREDHEMTDPELCVDPASGIAKGGRRLTPDFLRQYRVGYSIFVYDKDGANPARSRESRHLARLIARRIQALGRLPSNHHLPQEDCQSCETLDAKLGVFHQNLAILREARCPAVLIEVGNIVDPDDERIVNNDQFRSRLAEAIRQGTQDYFSRFDQRQNRKHPEP